MSADIRDLEIVGDYAYLGTNNFEIVDVSDPSNPTMAGAYDVTNSLYGGVAVEGGIECKGYGTGGTGADQPAQYVFGLGQNYPNPFNPATTIGFTVDRESAVMLSIYDVAGKLVRTLVDGRLPMGTYQRQWNGRDHNGQSVATGVYYLHMAAAEVTTVRKVVFVR